MQGRTHRGIGVGDRRWKRVSASEARHRVRERAERAGGDLLGELVLGGADAPSKPPCEPPDWYTAPDLRPEPCPLLEWLRPSPSTVPPDASANVDATTLTAP